jgi:hypothetical protein
MLDRLEVILPLPSDTYVDLIFLQSMINVILPYDTRLSVYIEVFFLSLKSIEEIPGLPFYLFVKAIL